MMLAALRAPAALSGRDSTSSHCTSEKDTASKAADPMYEGTKQSGETWGLGPECGEWEGGEDLARGTYQCEYVNMDPSFGASRWTR